jgi:hypothetical protein
MREDDAGLIDAFLQEPLPAGAKRKWDGTLRFPIQELAAGKALMALPPVRRVDAAIEVLERLAVIRHATGVTDRRGRLRLLADRLLRGKLPVDAERLAHLVETAASLQPMIFLPVAQLVRLCEEHVERAGLDGRLAAALETFAKGMDFIGAPDEQQQRLAAVRQGKPISKVKDEPPPVTLAPGDAWADALLAALHPLALPERGAWKALLTHCSTATASAPARKWLDRAAELVRAIGDESFAGLAAQALAQIGKPGSRPPVRRGYNEPTLIDEAQADLLRGLVWACSTVADEKLLAAVGQAAAACFHKITWYGPRDVKVGNACLQTLSLATGRAAVSQLARLRLKIKHPSALTQLGKALERVAQREGISAQELEEISVPTFDLDATSRRTETLGDFTAELRIGPDGAVELAWTRSDGTPQKSVPAAVRTAHAAELAELKRVLKEIPAVLAAQRDRLERLCLSPRTWSLADWRERYLDPPLVGPLARRLLWTFRDDVGETVGETVAVWSDGRFVDVEGQPFEPSPESQVALWHPLDAAAEDVGAWRRRLTALGITQPFKQAHREIYRLTDAERATGTYSNRFAAQILKQHQLAALCTQRGWRYKLQGQWDSHNVPFYLAPEHGLRIELMVDPFAEDEVSPTYVYLYVATDYVRFFGDSGELPLADVPPRAFSELMRDVDLFVSVCHAGNDPAWVDQARRREIQYDWQGYTFGPLSATAATRRDVLAGLLPKLKIADRCTLGDRYLTVRGDLRTYKIHLGSGNILMEPNDQYLCIVPGSSGARGPKAFLPYEGDGMLDIILSKAFLLADDKKIKDFTIVRQIQGG